MIKTVVELDLVGYSTICDNFEQGLDVNSAAQLNQQIQSFVDAGLKAVGASRDESVMQTTGDGAIVVFETADDAHRFAHAVHEATQRHNRQRKQPLAKRIFRIGAASGDIVMQPKAGGGFDIAGMTIARAVRLEAKAQPGGLLVDEETFQSLAADQKERYGAKQQVAGKRDEEFEAYACQLNADGPGDAVFFTSHAKKEADAKPWSGAVESVIAPTRLHHGAEHLFGREQELAGLDQAWNDPSTHVLTIVAFGGVGKTSLIFEWMARQAAKNWEGFERVFDWSFYSQGTSERGAASADTFIAEALKFFGDEAMAQSAASAWDKGARLAHLVALHRTLLVLDGVEPLQYPPGPLAGKLKDPALEQLLRGLAQRNPGLCIVTTREGVVDLAPFRETTAPEWELEFLSDEAGAALLHQSGANRAGAVVIKQDDPELRAASREVGGHALTLRLLGSYLALAEDGDIRKRDLVELEDADREFKTNAADADKAYGHAFKVMRAYEEWLKSGGDDGLRQLAVLRLLGLFDRPADGGCLAALRKGPAIAGLTEPLVNLSEAQWNVTITRLANCGLVSVASDIPQSAIRNPRSVDAHPLLREYFAQRLRTQHPDAWRAAHRRIYEHLCETTKEGDQPTLEDLQPLYQAVAHGCQAGLQQEACDKVYIDRINHGMGNDGFYVTRKLGAFGSELGAVAPFFEQPWSRISPALIEPAQAFLLNQAAFRLRALGRLTEALETMRATKEQVVQHERWKNAAQAAGNLSELELTLGEVAGAVGDAEQSVTYADRSGDAFQRISGCTTHANALHQAGRRAAAQTYFRKAEQMQADRQPDYPLLYGLSGFEYCELFLAAPEGTAWQMMLELNTQHLTLETSIESCRAVSQRAAKMFEWRVPSDSLLDIALDHLTLGRAALYEVVLAGCGLPFKTQNLELKTSIDAAVRGLRRAGTTHWIPAALLTRAWLRFVNGARTGPESAQEDLDEAWEIAERGPMRLHMADIHLYRARLFHGVKPYPWTSPQEDLAAARKLIEQCGYWRRKEELEDAEEAAKNW